MLRRLQFERKQHAFGNFWYQLTKSVKVGAEALRLQTTRPEGANQGWRFTTSAMLMF